MRGLPQGRSRPRSSKVATMVVLEGILTMSSSPKVNIVSGVFEVVIKVKAGLRINPGPHFE